MVAGAMDLAEVVAMGLAVVARVTLTAMDPVLGRVLAWGLDRVLARALDRIRPTATGLARGQMPVQAKASESMTAQALMGQPREVPGSKIQSKPDRQPASCRSNIKHWELTN